jgi:nucleotide-binding universal stress UspA family protein
MAESIVVGTDGSETAALAVAEAVRLASALQAEVHVVSAYDPAPALAAGLVVAPLDDPTAVALAQAADLLRAANVPFTTHEVRGSPEDALVEVANEVGASMIVVGNQGMRGILRVFGSVPNSVSHRARCNVLIVSTARR